MRKYLLSILILSQFLSFNTASAQVPNLVKDIYVGINPSNTDLTGIAYGSGILFSSNDGIAGTELWYSNGSNLGTVMVKDIYPGSLSSAPSNFLQLGSKVLFLANDGVNGQELWITDNTLAGTVMVKDINPGSASSGASNFTVFGSKILFLATTASEGKELWITDGTSAGTTLVKDIWPGATASNIVQITNSGLGYIYFIANDGTTGEELWKSDGTTGGTILLNDILPGTGFSNISIFKMAGPNLLFAADNGVNGKELWKSDGTMGGTSLVKDFNPGLPSTFGGTTQSIAYNNKLFFVAAEPVNGSELWESDGTNLGTIVNNLTPGSVGSFFNSNFYNYGGDMYFFRHKNALSQDSMIFYKVSSTVSACSRVKSYGAPSSSGLNFYVSFIQTNNNKFVGVPSNCFGTRNVFFVSDGTTLGSNISSNYAKCFTSPPVSIPFINNSWLYPVSSATLGTDFEIHNIDYTTGSPSLTKNINSSNSFNNSLSSSWYYQTYSFNSKYFFIANDASTGDELWGTDGTNVGTNLLLDIYTGMNGGPVSVTGSFNSIITANNMFFYANDGFTGRELWAIGAGPTSMNENENRIFENIFVFPNPANDKLHFNVSTEYFSKNRTEYFIYNSIGQICGQGVLSENKINIAYLADGFYTLNLKSENGMTTLKFVKN